ncbi:MAG TPA: hypothetical protein VFN74_06385 [Chloroflexota bacterium]|nr:hypothetical protein [Chloroflexota bacterium]
MSETQTMTPEEIRTVGLRALVEALGADGALRFIQQFDRGNGDYTAARQKWADDLDLKTLLAHVDALRNQPKS